MPKGNTQDGNENVGMDEMIKNEVAANVEEKGSDQPVSTERNIVESKTTGHIKVDEYDETLKEIEEEKQYLKKFEELLYGKEKSEEKDGERKITNVRAWFEMGTEEKDEIESRANNWMGDREGLGKEETAIQEKRLKYFVEELEKTCKDELDSIGYHNLADDASYDKKLETLQEAYKGHLEDHFTYDFVLVCDVGVVAEGDEAKSLTVDVKTVEDCDGPEDPVLRAEHGCCPCLAACCGGDKSQKTEVVRNKDQTKRIVKGSENKTWGEICEGKTAIILGNLDKAGLKFKVLLSVQRDEYYILFGADEIRLRKEADRLEFDMPLHPYRTAVAGVEKGYKLARKWKKFWKKRIAAAAKIEEKKRKVEDDDEGKGNNKGGGFGGLVKLPKLEIDKQVFEGFTSMADKNPFFREKKDLFEGLYGSYKKDLHKKDDTVDVNIYAMRGEADNYVEKCTQLFQDNPGECVVDGGSDNIDYTPEYMRGYHRHPVTPFTNIVRLKLTRSITEAEGILGGASLQLVGEARKKGTVVQGFYPVHDKVELRELDDKHMKNPISVWKQPLDLWRAYYGEGVGLYFAFLSYYTTWLVPAAAIGAVFFVSTQATGESVNEGTSLCAIIMIVWASAFYEGWKRKTAHLRMEWGMFNFKEKESDRPEFHGKWQVSTVTGELTEELDVLDKFQRLAASQTVTVSFIFGVIAVVIGGLMLKMTMINTNRDNVFIGKFLPSGLNAVFIMVCNQIWKIVSVKLNDFENHQTDSAYEDNLVSKSFLFKFINSYTSLFIIAFVKQYIEELGFCLGSYLEMVRRVPTDFMTAHGENWQDLLLPTGKGFADIPAWFEGPYNTTAGAARVGWAEYNGVLIEDDAKMNEITGTIDTLCFNWENPHIGGRTNSLAAKLADATGRYDELADAGSDGYKKVCEALTVFLEKQDPGYVEGYAYRGDCVMDLALQLGILFAVQIVLNNMMEVGFPLLRYMQRKKAQSAESDDGGATTVAADGGDEEAGDGKEKLVDSEAGDGGDDTEAGGDAGDAPGGEKEKSTFEEEFEFDQYEGTMADYDELAVQFGYVVLFVVAFPLTPLFALLNNWVENYVDGYKLLRITRRPHPKGMYDMGTWGKVLSILAYLAIITNVLILVLNPIKYGGFKVRSIDRTLDLRMIVFLGLEHCLILVKLIIGEIVPDESEEVKQTRERNERVVVVLIGN